MGVIRKLGDFWSILYVNGSREEISGETINGENLQRADLTYRDIASTKFIDCDLRGANFDGSVMDCRTSFEGCKLDDHTRIVLEKKLNALKESDRARDQHAVPAKKGV